MTARPQIANRNISRRRIKGATLLEYALVMMLVAVSLGPIGNIINEYIVTSRLNAASQKLEQVHEAAAKYVKVRYEELINTVPDGPDVSVVLAGRPTATASAPRNSLQDLGFLPTSFIDNNSYSQRHAVLIKKTNGNALEVMVTTYGGEVITDNLLGKLVMSLGSYAGYVPSNPLPGLENAVIGAYGSWRSLLNTWNGGSQNPSPGRLATTNAFEDGAVVSDYLHRFNVGVPEANRMRTSIDMSGNELRNVSAITGSPTISDDLRVAQNIWAGADIESAGDVRVGEDLEVTRDAEIGRNLSIDGDLTVEQDANIKGKTETDDLVANAIDADALIYSDSRGIKRSDNIRLSDALPRIADEATYHVASNMTTGQRTVPKPSCAGDTSRARIQAYRKTESSTARYINGFQVSINGQNVVTDNTQSFVEVFDDIYARDRGNSWVVDFIGQGTALDIPRAAVVQTSCVY
ncbi:shufflon system plasmid conjugative transfer pilus tip adhesin PilV [Pseudovibrio ascidiaceicola]|uniref:shufflon system plasmid conjugative transfer pilus tip adhesin PilV n=1 Tax=Pseudovibrio ascidiaceicola TaxID=285279 RepID=UPI003D3666DD